MAVQDRRVFGARVKPWGKTKPKGEDESGDAEQTADGNRGRDLEHVHGPEEARCDHQSRREQHAHLPAEDAELGEADSDIDGASGARERCLTERVERESSAVNQLPACRHQKVKRKNGEERRGDAENRSCGKASPLIGGRESEHACAHACGRQIDHTAHHRCPPHRACAGRVAE
eukprot:scaffold90857_cov37-Tisochrysis_lutea.AAC.1